MKRIAFFSGDITGNGGTERVGTLIANALAQQGQYEIFFISLVQEREMTTFPLSDKISCDVLAERRLSPGLGYLSLIPRLKAYVKEKKIDLIIDIDSVLDVLSLPVKWMTGVRVISWEHFYYYDVRGTWYRRPIRRLTTRFADAIVTLTEQDREYYLENGADPGKVCAIHNPVYDSLTDDVHGFSHRDSEGAECSRGSRKVIFSAGALSQIKGFVQVPLIAKYVKERYPGISFTWKIAGEGAMRGEIGRRIEEYGVKDEVKLLGQMTDMRSLYAQADIYVMTSEREGLPMVLLEAKQYGLPIVSYDIRTGPSEVITDGVNGYLIPFTGDEQNDASAMADAIGRLLSDEELYRSFVRNTKEHMEDFLLERVVGQWETLIGKVIG